MIRDICGVPVLGVVPYLCGLDLPEEDGASLDARGGKAPGPGLSRKLDIAAIRLPRVSNFDDLDALALEKGVKVRFIARASEFGEPDAIILPGSKATLADLDWLKSEGLDDGIRWNARLGASVVGICGGYQMLGETIFDPEGIEGPRRKERGLGLLPISTIFMRGKDARPRRGRVAPGGGGFLAAAAGMTVEGYEIHAGRSASKGPALLALESGTAAAEELDGCWAEEGRIFGTYLHGLFDLPDFRRAWLSSLGRDGRRFTASGGQGATLAAAREAGMEKLADAVSVALDMDTVHGIIGI
jgi:adenosylcobyric acid synthase